MPPVVEHELPRSLIERFVQTCGDPELGLVACLRAIILGL